MPPAEIAGVSASQSVADSTVPKYWMSSGAGDATEDVVDVQPG